MTRVLENEKRAYALLTIIDEFADKYDISSDMSIYQECVAQKESVRLVVKLLQVAGYIDND